jgi:hypothetical protein
MTEQQTCGQGLAGRAPVPAKLAELAVAMADVLENHMTAIDLADENGKLERDAYASLVRRLREVAAQLEAISDEMAGYRDLPMARHDIETLASPRSRSVFERLVRVESELAELSGEMLERDRQMLGDMRAG